MNRSSQYHLGESLYDTAKGAYQKLARGYRMLGGTRILSASRRALPAFIIVGTQKGGTSSLYSYLAAHSRVAPPSRKEVHFFDVYFSRGVAWYRSHFPRVSTLERDGAITFEASPYYLYHPHAPARIAQVVPAAKLVVCLRNPVSRAISHYWHEFARGAETLPMEAAFARERERLEGEKQRVETDATYNSHAHRHQSYLDRGLYADQIARYLKLFDRRDILVLRSEDLFRDTQDTYDRVLRFVGLAPEPLRDLSPQNTGSYRGETPEAVKTDLARFFEPHNERLYATLGLDSPWW